MVSANTWGANGLVSRHENSDSVFYTFDERGTTAQRLDENESVLTSHMADAFGTFASSSSTTDPYAGFGSQWGYYKDWETGLQLLGHRYYDPGTGRFVTRDPIGYEGGINLYGYVGNSPTGWIDPDGLHPIRDVIAKMGRGLLKRYDTDHEFKSRIHRILEKDQNKKGARGICRNPDTSDEGIREAVELAEGYSSKQKPRKGRGRFWDTLKAIIEFIDPTPVGLGIEVGKAMGDAVDPYVKEKQKQRQEQFDKWLSED